MLYILQVSVDGQASVAAEGTRETIHQSMTM